MAHTVLIVGGGLAGLAAAQVLQKAGVQFLLLEARNRLGGRILSADGAGDPAADGFDLGPSWFWPQSQLQLADLVQNLGLSIFPQHSDGDIVVQRMSREAPQRYRGFRQEPQSMRISGGTGQLIAAMAKSLPADAIQLNSRVTHVSMERGEAVLRYVGTDGTVKSATAAHVIFAMPPRLVEARTLFTPALDVQTADRWRATPTWMAPHAKFFAIYQHPFWRSAGLSGTAQSMVGPLVEIHDATTASGQAALFGFVGVPAAQRSHIDRQDLITASVHQLSELFGPQAAAPLSTLLQDWAADPLTATDDDQAASGHPMADGRPWVTGKWKDTISMAGSETSLTEPGYLAGAVEAGQRTAEAVISRLSRPQHLEER